MMSSRKPGYLIGVFLLAFIFTAPQIAGVAGAGFAMYWTGGRWPFPTLPGLGFGQSVMNSWNNFHYWGGSLASDVHLVKPEDDSRYVVILRDPESGTERRVKPKLPSNESFECFAIGDHLWYTNRKRTFEVVGEDLKETAAPISRPRVPESQMFLWKGDLAYVNKTPAGFTVYAFQNDDWNLVGDLVLPDFSQISVGSEFGPLATSLAKKATIQVLVCGDDFHVFLQNEGRLFHRKGLEFDLDPKSKSIPPNVSDDKSIETISYKSDRDAISGETSRSGNSSGWSLVREKPAPPDDTGLFFLHGAMAQGILIDGRPAALIVDTALSGETVGHLFRQVGTEWTEFDSHAFPFGSKKFRTMTSVDGQRSYVAVTTTIQIMRLFALEATGIRATQGLDRAMNSAFFDVMFNMAILVLTSALGILLGLGVWGFMRLYTTSEYEFGHQTVRLASLGWRGFARLIDLGFIGLTTIGLGALLMRGFDWISFAEALNLHVDHSTVRTALRVILVLAIWLFTCVGGLLMAQSVWGLTFGKWICRLRTVRTSLRPIGFARSLAREIAFCVDCGNFICWTPGILCIAITDCRQRLGDLVADTIVINSRSLAAAAEVHVSEEL